MPTVEHGKFLNQLPSDWEKVPISALGEVHAGSTPRRSNHKYWNGSIAWVTPGELTGLKGKWLSETSDRITEAGLNSCSVNLMPPGTILVTTRATIGNIAISTIPITTNQGFKSIVPDGTAEPEFYYYMLQLIIPEMQRLASGSTFNEISGRNFSSIIVPRPPIAEQRRIAEILDTADDAIQQTEAVIAKLKQVKAGLLHDLLTRGLDENGQLRDPEAHPEQFKETEIGLVPRGWEVARLLDRISLPHGQVDPRHEPYRHWPLIAPNHIESGMGRLLEVATAAEQGAISGKYPFEPGDVIYSKIRPYLRKAVLAESEGLSSADMYPLRAGPNIVPRFLQALILAEEFTRFAESVSMRSGIPKINRDELGEFETAFPSWEEQKRIASILEAHDERILSEEAYRDKLQQVKRGLMQDLLTGRVRV